MEKKFQVLITLFILIALISLAGFFNSYISKFPNLDEFPILIHIHFAAFLCWFILLIIQPVLIKQKKYRLHRKLGKLSYFLAPILVITILILVKIKVQRLLPVSESDATVNALIGLMDALSFSIYYIIAMVNKQNVRWHVAFILAASLIILNPGMARLFNEIKPGLGMLASIIVPFAVSIGIIIYEKIKMKRAIFKSPYFIFFMGWAFEILLLITLPDTDFWKNFVLSYMG